MLRYWREWNYVGDWIPVSCKERWTKKVCDRLEKSNRKILLEKINRKLDEPKDRYCRGTGYIISCKDMLLAKIYLLYSWSLVNLRAGSESITWIRNRLWVFTINCFSWNKIIQSNLHTKPSFTKVYRCTFGRIFRSSNVIDWILLLARSLSHSLALPRLSRKGPWRQFCPTSQLRPIDVNKSSRQALCRNKDIAKF